MNRPLKLGIAGLGTVGTGLLQLLAEHRGRLARNAGRGIELSRLGVLHADQRQRVLAQDLPGAIKFGGGDESLGALQVEHYRSMPKKPWTALDLLRQLIGEGGIAKHSGANHHHGE
jgi:homoserine dehydrogenase